MRSGGGAGGREGGRRGGAEWGGGKNGASPRFGKLGSSRASLVFILDLSKGDKESDEETC